MNKKNILIAILIATAGGVLVNVITHLIDKIPGAAITKVTKTVTNLGSQKEIQLVKKIHKTVSLSCKGALLQIGCSRSDVIKEDCPTGWERVPKIDVVTVDGGNGWAKWLVKDNKNDCSFRLHIGTGQYSSQKTVVATVYIKKK